MPSPIIHLNAFPGVGKLTIARRLVALLSAFNGRLLHNHLLIDPVGAILPRSSNDYQPLRRAVRTVIFDALVKSSDTFDSVYVCTDFQSSDAIGRGVMEEYETMAKRRDCSYVPVTLTCDKEENLKRLVSKERAIHGKLIDVKIVADILGNDELHRFTENPLQMELDVTTLEPGEVAQLIYKHVLEVCPELKVGGDRTEGKG